MNISKWVVTFVVSGVLAVGSVDMAQAKNKAKGHGKSGKNVTRDVGKGNGPKSVPPGQIKRYTRGAKLPGDVQFDDISDLSKWKMGPLGAGERYIKVDNDILRVSNTMEVLGVIGIAGDLLK